MTQVNSSLERTGFRRLGATEDSAPLLNLYRRAIACIDDGLYSEPEKQVWSQWADVTEVADGMLRQGITVLAIREGRLQGFAQLMPDGLINMLYVDPDASRQGIGSALVATMEQLARHLGGRQLYTRASHASRPLFVRAGFLADGRESIQASTDVHIARTVMVKDLRISRR